MDLKSSFGNEGVNSSIELMKNLDYLVIDDVGGRQLRHGHVMRYYQQ